MCSFAILDNDAALTVSANVMEPIPGQNDVPIHLRPRDDYLGDVTVTTDFLGSHSYKDDIAALLGEIDSSENKIKTLKVTIVEKENFIDSLIKREDILQADLSTDHIAVNELTRYT